MILRWFTVIPLGFGRVSVHGGALEAHIFLLVLVLVLARFSGSAGAGRPGDSIGMAGSFVTEADLMRSTVMLSTTATPIFMETTGGSGLMDRVIASRAGLVDQGNIVLKRAEGQGTEEA